MIRIFEDKKIACTEHISQRVAQTELPREAIGWGGGGGFNCLWRGVHTKIS